MPKKNIYFGRKVRDGSESNVASSGDQISIRHGLADGRTDGRSVGQTDGRTDSRSNGRSDRQTVSLADGTSKARRSDDVL